MTKKMPGKARSCSTIKEEQLLYTEHRTRNKEGAETGTEIQEEKQETKGQIKPRAVSFKTDAKM